MLLPLSEPASLAKIIAHRGASGQAPENTVAAMQLAADQGASCVEIDVSISSDNVPFAHHDPTLNRCTSGTGYLYALKAIELDQLTASNGMPEYKNEPLARLSAVLDVLISNRLALNLEIKPTAGLEIPTAKAVCKYIEERWPADLTLVLSSISTEALRITQECLPDVPRALVVGVVPENWRQQRDTLGFRNIHCAAQLIKQSEIDDLRRHGLGVYCFTVNDTVTAETVIGMGVDGVFTDYPGKFLSAL